MSKPLKSFILSMILLLNQNAVALQDQLIQRYEKSFLQNTRIDFAAIFSGDYGEVRWDKNGDGKIDIWFLRKGALEVQEDFENDQIKRVSVRQRVPGGYISLEYTLAASGSMKLTENEFRPFQLHNNSAASDEDAGMSFGAAVANSSQKSGYHGENVCKTPIETFFGSAPADWVKIQSAVSAEGQRTILSKMVSDECKSLLSPKEQEQLFKSVLNIYELDLDGKVEDNKMLSCLVQFKEMRDQLPIIATTLALAPFSKPQLKINCVSGEERKCGQASFDEKSCKIDLAVSKPACKENMELVFTADIFHETIHSALPKLSEESVSAITNTCLKAEVKTGKSEDSKSEQDPSVLKQNKITKEETSGNKDLQKLAEDAAKQAELKVDKDTLANLKSKEVGIWKMPTAAIKDVNSKAAPSKVTNVPAEIAAGKVGPGTPIGDKSGYASLNSDFRPVSSVSESSKPTLNESYSRSVARTSPVLSMANSLVRGAVVAPAQAQTASNSSTESRVTRSIASSSDSHSRTSNTSSRSSVSKVKPEWISKGSSTGASASVSNSSQENFVMPSGPQANQISQGSAGRNEPSGSEIAGSGKSQNIAPAVASNKTARNPASSGNSNSAVKASGQGSAQSPGQAPVNAQRDFYTKQLGLKRGNDLWDFVKKNNDNLKNQGIHILDTNNRIWGHTNPENAVIRFREQNNRLIREN